MIPKIEFKSSRIYNSNFKKKKVSKRLIILISIGFLLLGALIILGFIAENRIYSQYNFDCASFSIWTYYYFNGMNLSLCEIGDSISPLTVFTGPISIRNELASRGFESSFKNNYSIDRIKRSLDNGESVIAVVNQEFDLSTDSTHFVFIKDYNESGFFIYDSVIFARYYQSKNGRMNILKPDKVFAEPFFINNSAFKVIYNSYSKNRGIITFAQKVVGFNQFSIVLNNEEDDVSLSVRFMLKIEKMIEGLIKGFGSFIKFLSPRI